MKVILNNMIELHGLTERQAYRVMRDLFIERKREENIELFSVTGDPGTRILHIPMGWLPTLEGRLAKSTVNPERIDNRRDAESKEGVIFKGELFELQKGAVEALLSNDIGILQAPCGCGKTVMTINAICQKGQKALIIVDKKVLLEQWADTIEGFTNLSYSIVQGDTVDLSGDIVIGMRQTVPKHLDKMYDIFSILVADETHQVCTMEYQKILNGINPKTRWGVSATPWREDGLDDQLFTSCGKIIHKITKEEAQAAGIVVPAYFKQLKTNFIIPDEIVSNDIYNGNLTTMWKDDERNRFIVDTIKREVAANPGTTLVITKRVGHIKLLERLLTEEGLPAVGIYGKHSPEERRERLKHVQNGYILVATASLVGTGFDMPKLSNVFITMPMQSEILTIQLIGRITRSDKANGKVCGKVFDIFDYNTTKAAQKRWETYNKQGILDMEEGDSDDAISQSV